MPMRLVFLAADFPPAVGGIQTYVAELCRALAERGEQLTVIATRQPAAEEFDATVPYPVVRVAAGDLAGVAMRMSAAAVELSPRPDALVATKWSPDGVAAVLACRRLRLPYLVMGYGREFIQTGGNLMKWAVQRAVIRRAAGALVISRYTQRLMQRRGLPPRRVKVIYAGVSAGDYAAGAAGVAQLKSQLGITDEKVILTVKQACASQGPGASHAGTCPPAGSCPATALPCCG